MLRLCWQQTRNGRENPSFVGSFVQDCVFHVGDFSETWIVRAELAFDLKHAGWVWPICQLREGLAIFQDAAAKCREVLLGEWAS
jgi:hypothetical protein